jgi:micrococcal nuclease
MKLKKLTGLLLVLLGLFGVSQQLMGLPPKAKLTDTSSSINAPQTFATQGDSNQKAEETRTACRVLTVYDGDTIGCDLNGNRKINKPTEEIRMLGIDTPEMHYSRKNKSHGTDHEQDEPFAKASGDFATELLLKKTVYLSFDKNREDKYHRTLAYVYLQPEGGESVSETMLKKGLATVLIIRPNFKLADRLTALEDQAKSAKIGLWAGSSEQP